MVRLFPACKILKADQGPYLIALHNGKIRGFVHMTPRRDDPHVGDVHVITRREDATRFHDDPTLHNVRKMLRSVMADGWQVSLERVKQ